MKWSGHAKTECEHRQGMPYSIWERCIKWVPTASEITHLRTSALKCKTWYSYLNAINWHIIIYPMQYRSQEITGHPRNNPVKFVWNWPSYQLTVFPFFSLVLLQFHKVQGPYELKRNCTKLFSICRRAVKPIYSYSLRLDFGDRFRYLYSYNMLKNSSHISIIVQRIYPHRTLPKES